MRWSFHFGKSRRRELVELGREELIFMAPTLWYLSHSCPHSFSHTSQPPGSKMQINGHLKEEQLMDGKSNSSETLWEQVECCKYKGQLFSKMQGELHNEEHLRYLFNGAGIHHRA